MKEMSPEAVNTKDLWFDNYMKIIEASLWVWRMPQSLFFSIFSCLSSQKKYFPKSDVIICVNSIYAKVSAGYHQRSIKGQLFVDSIGNSIIW